MNERSAAPAGMLARLDSLLPLRWWWVILIAMLVQRATITFVPATEELRWLRIALFLGSAGLVLGPVWANRTRWGAWILGAGIVLNIVAMVANGGYMPVSPEARALSGRQAAMPLTEPGSLVPKSKGVLLPPEQTNLYLLTDIIVVGPPINKSISIGDVVLMLGVVVLGSEFAAEAWRHRNRTRAPVATP